MVLNHGHKEKLRRIDTDATVFRWDTGSYKEISKYGFKSWSQGETPNSVYYNLYDYVHHGDKTN